MALSAARAAADSTVVGLDFDPSPVPLLGPLIDRLRQAVHQLVVFYVNKSAKKQIVVNTHLISALDALAQELAEREEQQREIADLRRELQAVRDALAAPESR